MSSSNSLTRIGDNSSSTISTINNSKCPITDSLSNSLKTILPGVAVGEVEAAEAATYSTTRTRTSPSWHPAGVTPGPMAATISSGFPSILVLLILREVDISINSNSNSHINPTINNNSNSILEDIDLLSLNSSSSTNNSNNSNSIRTRHPIDSGCPLQVPRDLSSQ